MQTSLPPNPCADVRWRLSVPHAPERVLVDRVKFAALLDWLADGGRSEGGAPKFMEQICLRLVDAGIPLWRTGVFVRTLHPQVFGRSFVWRPGAPEVTVFTADFDVLESDEYRASPLSTLYATGAAVRLRVSSMPMTCRPLRPPCRWRAGPSSS